jgi:hypothetical protein
MESRPTGCCPSPDQLLHRAFGVAHHVKARRMGMEVVRVDINALRPPGASEQQDAQGFPFAPPIGLQARLVEVDNFLRRRPLADLIRDGRRMPNRLRPSPVRFLVGIRHLVEFGCAREGRKLGQNLLVPLYLVVFAASAKAGPDDDADQCSHQPRPHPKGLYDRRRRFM